MSRQSDTSGAAVRLGAVGSLVSGTILVIVLTLIYEPYQGFEQPHRIILIPRAAALPEIAAQLESHGIVRSSELFKWYVRLAYEDPSLKAGEYRFEGSSNIPEVADKLGRGIVHYHRITVPEGLTLEEISPLFAQSGFGIKEEFKKAMARVELIEDLDPEAGNLEGYLFPDTYFLTRDMNEQDIVRVMVENFRRMWTPERVQRALDLGFTVRQVVTLASLIEAETAVSGERPLVSAVFHNRLERNLKLECDPTVIYAVKLVKEFDGVINRSDLKIDSPYNTYLYPGLPPGPIASPGLKAVEAALHPADTEYLYFVSKNDGTHFFSATYSEHRRAVQRYRR